MFQDNDAPNESHQYSQKVVTFHEHSINFNGLPDNLPLLQLARLWSRNNPNEIHLFEGYVYEDESVPVGFDEVASEDDDEPMPQTTTPNIPLDASVDDLLSNHLVTFRKAKQRKRKQYRSKLERHKTRLRSMNIHVST